ncbi:LANO_0F00210g1_1 [Lachancea nothofagi CBS 11611]|uniref:LANO_0F00210g1_1 n=1 Tax=Lachancea nothofagi CBS 11611 TaxID=1266666 RepID=A0A1G4K5C9_9SACH|nr:LANO_0F00210g1_1 [Lachancea nothofagi CBS 11611]
MTEISFGHALPSNLDYAVTFGIPTWDSAIGYVEKDPKFVSKMATGYPRYFPQPAIQELCSYFTNKYGRESESCRPFPSLNAGLECLKHVQSVIGHESEARLEVESLVFESNANEMIENPFRYVITIAAVLAPENEFEVVKEYWKLAGECVSSRLAVFVNQFLHSPDFITSQKSPEASAKLIVTMKEGDEAKILLKRRIAQNHCHPFGSGRLKQNGEDLILNPEKDVHLMSSGMSAIFTARKLLTFWDAQMRSEHALNKSGLEPEAQPSARTTAVIFGFPFKDTRVIMENFGNCEFFGFGDSKDLTKLKRFLDTGKQQILAVFVETPSNPLLNMPDLGGLRKLANEHGFFIVVDDTIGGLNIEILAFADIVCSSLTKLFSGSSNVMGGSLILNPKSSLYPCAKEYFSSNKFEDLLWCQDAVALEINSRNFEDRTLRTNENTEKLLSGLLLSEEKKTIKKIYYPTLSSTETLKNYEFVRTERGGYGCLFSLAFYNEQDAEFFYNSLKVFKGPSNGTNFTLACPYVHLAHHFELEEVSQFGADPNFVRVSVGLENIEWLLKVFSEAIEVVKLNRSDSKVNC